MRGLRVDFDARGDGFVRRFDPARPRNPSVGSFGETFGRAFETFNSTRILWADGFASFREPCHWLRSIAMTGRDVFAVGIIKERSGSTPRVFVRESRRVWFTTRRDDSTIFCDPVIEPSSSFDTIERRLLIGL